MDIRDVSDDLNEEANELHLRVEGPPPHLPWVVLDHVEEVDELDVEDTMGFQGGETQEELGIIVRPQDVIPDPNYRGHIGGQGQQGGNNEMMPPHAPAIAAASVAIAPAPSAGAVAPRRRSVSTTRRYFAPLVPGEERPRGRPPYVWECAVCSMSFTGRTLMRDHKRTAHPRSSRRRPRRPHPFLPQPNNDVKGLPLLPQANNSVNANNPGPSFGFPFLLPQAANIANATSGLNLRRLLPRPPNNNVHWLPLIAPANNNVIVNNPGPSFPLLLPQAGNIINANPPRPVNNNVNDPPPHPQAGNIINVSPDRHYVLHIIPEAGGGNGDSEDEEGGNDLVIVVDDEVVDMMEPHDGSAQGA